MEWLNEPASWQRTGDVLTVSVDPGTDFWRETGYGYIRDSGHVYGEVLAGDLDISVRLRCKLSAQYDQVGVMLRADERTWLKTGVEFFEGRPRLSTVLTLGRSSWMVTDLPEGTDDIVLRVSRRGDAVEVRYVIEDGPPELAALVFLPPGREVLAGVMAAAPEGPGFRVTFHDLRITERDWSAPGADGTAAWPDNQEQAGWAGEQSPEWTPADGEPGWPVPETGEGTPEWPGPAAEPQTPVWPVPAAVEEDHDWAAPADETAEPAEPAWTAPAMAEEPDWPDDAEDLPGWVASLAADVADPQDAAGAGFAEDGPAGHEPPEPAEGPAGPGLAEPEPARAEAAEPVPAPPGPAAREPADQESAGHGPVDQEASKPGPPWAPAPPPSTMDWSKPAPGDGPGGVDPAVDWERLAAGAQGAPDEPAARWSPPADADVASEWPGPPLRTAMRNGLLSTDTVPGPAFADSEDDAQTDPGLSRPGAVGPSGALLSPGSTPPRGQAPGSEDPEPPAGPPARFLRHGAGAGPDPAEPSGTAAEASAAPAEASTAPAEASTAPAEASAAPQNGTTEPGGGAPDQDEPGEPAPSAREARRRSKRATAAQVAEPDAADEWISLLTADPVEE
jgi:uncharacterized protein